jgi:glycosyltransferase involved in cell wall biosynthesis
MQRFSVIIPVHNRPAQVRQAIDSVLIQAFPDCEIIVVDDGSTDDTPSVLLSYGSRIRVITLAQQQGCECARNAGVAASKGCYLAFLDSDDLMLPGALDTYDFIINVTRQPALLVSRLAYFTTDPPQPSAEQRDDTIELIVFDDYLSRDRSRGSTFSMIVVRRDVFDRVGGCRQSTASTYNMSDHDFLLRIGCQGPAVLLERPRTVAYRVHAGNSNRDVRRAVEGMRRIIKAERRGSYPGGRARLFARRAAIGGPLMHWSRQAFEDGYTWLAFRLLLAGSDMLLAKILKTFWIMLRGLKPITRLERTVLAQSISTDGAASP